MDPDEALQAFQDLGARLFVAMHWGTFKQSDEALEEPPRRLEAERSRRGILPERVRVLAIGESLEVRRPGHDPSYRNPNAYDPSTANALLDRMGYKRGADGWRRRPDGSPLELRMINGVTSESRRLAEFMKRSLNAISIRLDFDSMPGGDRLKRLSTCRFQLATMSFGCGAPDGVSAMANFHGPAIGTVNFSCYQNDDFDRTYEQLRVMPAGPERAPVFAKLTSLLDAHAPARILPSADDVTLIGPRVQGLVNPYLPLPYYLLDVVAPGR